MANANPTKNPTGANGGAVVSLNALASFQHAHGGKFRRSSQGGFQTNCPVCQRDNVHGTALGVTEGDDGRLLANCFKSGCRFHDVIGAVGLTWKDVTPYRNTPFTPAEREAYRRRMREVAVGSAAKELSINGETVKCAALGIMRGNPLTIDDMVTLMRAMDGIDETRQVFDRSFFDTRAAR